jgi:hypothetical protein
MKAAASQQEDAVKKVRRILVAAAVAGYLSAGAVGAQADPRQILGAMIYQVSTGTPNPNWYGAQLWQTIALQTGNTGIYPQLRQLGVVQNVTLTQWVPLPAGILYAMTVQHAFGQSYWVMGIGTFTNRIEYASFTAGPASTPYVLPSAPTTAPSEPAPVAPVGTAPPANPAPKPQPKDSQSEACKKFPNLC